MAIQLTTADYALVISLVSLGWNVWSKFIYPKPKLNVAVSLGSKLEELGELDSVVLECVNCGPTEVVVSGPVLPKPAESRAKASTKYLSITSMGRDVSGGKALLNGKDWPRKLPVGESVSVAFYVGSLGRCVADHPTGLGFRDSFERVHKLPKRAFDRVWAQIEKVT